MALELLEKLEELVSSYVLEVQNLKAKNRLLSDQVRTLTDQLHDYQSRQDGLQVELDEITALRTAHSKMELDRKRVRGMVRVILSDLDKIHII